MKKTGQAAERNWKNAFRCGTLSGICTDCFVLFEPRRGRCRRKFRIGSESGSGRVVAGLAGAGEAMIFAGRRGRNVFYLNRTGFAATGEKMKKKAVGSRFAYGTDRDRKRPLF